MSEQHTNRKNRELLKKIEDVCNQLSLWTLIQIYFYIKRVKLQRKWNMIVWNWLLSQSDTDERAMENDQ
jgi:hypothetical protein